MADDTTHQTPLTNIQPHGEAATASANQGKITN